MKGKRLTKAQFDPGKVLPPLIMDLINHPPHYCQGLLYEVIDVIEDWKLGFHEANAVKYIARAKFKGNEVQDLEKAVWYLNRRIQYIRARTLTQETK